MFTNTLENKKLISTVILMLITRNCLASDVEQYPVLLGISGSRSNNRSIAELNAMVPILQNQNSISMLDVKLKRDDKRSIEGNFGLVYRYNFSDKAILGIYSYFDRRKTQNNLIANQLTLGLELLSSHIDGRVNLYIPENKKKTLTSKGKTLVRNHTNLYVLQEGEKEEHTLPGYDLEVGPHYLLFRLH